MKQSSEISDHLPDTPIAELFARSPDQLSDSDLDSIIAKLRSMRANFLKGDVKAGKKTQTAAEKKRQAAAKLAEGTDLLKGLLPGSD